MIFTRQTFSGVLGIFKALSLVFFFDEGVIGTSSPTNEKTNYLKPFARLRMFKIPTPPPPLDINELAL
jgi:hypothetical protein